MNCFFSLPFNHLDYAFLNEQMLDLNVYIEACIFIVSLMAFNLLHKINIIRNVMYIELYGIL